MQIESLRYFIELSEARSFYAAAKKAHISQQGLNKSISSLEAELGVKLLERNTRGIRLTSRGERFLAFAKLVVQELDTTLDDLYAYESSNQFAEARAMVHATYYPMQLANVLFEQQRLLERTKLIETPFKQLLEKARHSDGSELFLVDLYPKAMDRLANESDLIFEPVFRSHLGVVWSKGSPFESCSVIHREQLTGIPVAANLQRDMAKLLDDVFEGFPPLTIAFGASNPRMTLEYAKASNDMVATFDSFGFSVAQKSPGTLTEGLGFTRLSTPQAQCVVGFIYPKTSKPNLRVRQIIEAVKRNLLEGNPDYYREYPLE